MRLEPPRIRESASGVVIEAVVSSDVRRDTIWFSVDTEWAGWLSDARLDAFVVPGLLMAMARGEELQVEGVMSERLFYNLVHGYAPIARCIMPQLKPARLQAAELSSEPLVGSAAGVVSGFSGGIDSYCVLADHLYGDVPAGYRITHLLFNNVGSHGQEGPDRGRELFRHRHTRLRHAAAELGLPFILIDSNLDDVLPIEFELTHRARNVAAALVLQKLFGRYLYASTFTYDACFIGPTYDAAYSDPAALHLLSTEDLECISAGARYTRVEKTARVAELTISHRYLDVCVNPRVSDDGNCSRCSKCARTLLTLEILGKADLYRSVFDLEQYAAVRERFMRHVLASDNPLLQEIVTLARERGWVFPAGVRLAAQRRRLARQARSSASALLRRLKGGQGAGAANGRHLKPSPRPSSLGW